MGPLLADTGARHAEATRGARIGRGFFTVPPPRRLLKQHKQQQLYRGEGGQHPNIRWLPVGPGCSRLSSYRAPPPSSSTPLIARRRSPSTH
ncbi:hypothetical protein MTO96_004142 [Rhipicephalus appendiculatus]